MIEINKDEYLDALGLNKETKERICKGETISCGKEMVDNWHGGFCHASNNEIFSYITVTYENLSSGSNSVRGLITKHYLLTEPEIRRILMHGQRATKELLKTAFDEAIKETK